MVAIEVAIATSTVVTFAAHVRTAAALAIDVVASRFVAHTQFLVPRMDVDIFDITHAVVGIEIQMSLSVILGLHTVLDRAAALLFTLALDFHGG